MSGRDGKGRVRTPSMSPEMRAIPAHQQREQLDQLERDRELLFASIGDLVVSGKYDRGCPKCGHEQSAKRYCTGREVDGAECFVLGEHLHGKCGGCGFAWLERCKDDEAMVERRGGLRFDEERVDGVIVPKAEMPNARELWGLPPA